MEMTLSAQTTRFLAETFPDENDINASILNLIEAEYTRRLSRHRRTDTALSRKYNMPFEQFVSQRMTRQLDYRWEAEQDAMIWESAIGGIMTVRRKLKQLRQHDA